MLELGGSDQIFQLQEFLNKLFLLVIIKSIHGAFSDWKQVGVFIKLSRLNSVMKSARYLLEVVKLKSPRWIICSS